MFIDLDLVLREAQSKGLDAIAQNAAVRAKLIYDFIDQSDGFYFNDVRTDFRSRMNVPFRIGGKKGNPEFEKLFAEEASKQGLLQLMGHPLFGGLRITLYNGISNRAIPPLLKFMNSFRKEFAARKIFIGSEEQPLLESIGVLDQRPSLKLMKSKK